MIKIKSCLAFVLLIQNFATCSAMTFKQKILAVVSCVAAVKTYQWWKNHKELFPYAQEAQLRLDREAFEENRKIFIENPIAPVKAFSMASRNNLCKYGATGPRPFIPIFYATAHNDYIFGGTLKNIFHPRAYKAIRKFKCVVCDNRPDDIMSRKVIIAGTDNLDLCEELKKRYEREVAHTQFVQNFDFLRALDVESKRLEAEKAAQEVETASYNSIPKEDK